MFLHNLSSFLYDMPNSARIGPFTEIWLDVTKNEAFFPTVRGKRWDFVEMTDQKINSRNAQIRAQNEILVQLF